MEKQNKGWSSPALPRGLGSVSSTRERGVVGRKGEREKEREKKGEKGNEEMKGGKTKEGREGNICMRKTIAEKTDEVLEKWLCG